MYLRIHNQRLTEMEFPEEHMREFESEIHARPLNPAFSSRQTPSDEWREGKCRAPSKSCFFHSDARSGHRRNERNLPVPTPDKRFGQSELLHSRASQVPPLSAQRKARVGNCPDRSRFAWAPLLIAGSFPCCLRLKSSSVRPGLGFVRIQAHRRR